MDTTFSQTITVKKYLKKLIYLLLILFVYTNCKFSIFFNKYIYIQYNKKKFDSQICIIGLIA